MFYVALRILLYDKVRSFITLLGIIFAVSLIFAQIGIYFGLMETSSVIIDHTPGDIWITSKNSKNFDFSQPFPEYKYFHLLSTDGVQWAEKLIVACGTASWGHPLKGPLSRDKRVLSESFSFFLSIWLCMILLSRPLFLSFRLRA